MEQAESAVKLRVVNVWNCRRSLGFGKFHVENEQRSARLCAAGNKRNKNVAGAADYIFRKLRLSGSASRAQKVESEGSSPRADAGENDGRRRPEFAEHLCRRFQERQTCRSTQLAPDRFKALRSQGSRASVWSAA